MEKVTRSRTTCNKFVLSSRSVVSAMVALLISVQAFSQNAVNILTSPATATVSVNQVFTVNVLVDFGTGSLSGVEAYLNFNPTYLQVNSAPTVPAGTQSSLPGVSVPFASVATMNSSGNVDHGRFTTAPIGSHPNSDFTLFTVEFRAIAVPPGGTTPITFNTTGFRETNAVEGIEPDILNTITGSTITISTCTPPTATLSNTPTCNGQLFNVFLSNASGASPFDLVVNGVTYNDRVPGSGAPATLFSYTPVTEKIWPANPTPTQPNNNDGAGIETGFKFRSSVSGFLKGIRFYLGGSTAGTYTGKLYNSSGSLMNSRQFTSVTANGWQEVTFTSPIQVTANTTYIASVYSSAGNYAQDDNFFNMGSVTNGSLTALAEGTDGSNGVYAFPAPSGGAFPTLTWAGHSPNYWVDVLFTPGSYTFNLTTVTDNAGCLNTGAPLQSLVVNSVDCSTLPVTLLNLSAAPQNKNIILRWSTATEIDNKGFEIQRSVSGGSWEGISFVNGAGNSSALLNYTYTDENLFPRRYNYRLKQVDIDGNYKYSMVVSAEVDGKAEYSLGQNYPNPFRTVTTIQYVLPVTSKVTLTVFDMNGRLVKVLVNEKKQAGTHAENFHVAGLPSGLYYYKIQAGDFTSVKKLILQ